MADPNVIASIRKAAQATGADPAALLATSLTESGARKGIVGDNGTSFGAFQFHVGGALGKHSPTWADSYQAYLNRAQEFQRLGVHGGKGAAAVQRPADAAGYAVKVDANLAKARELLNEHATIAAVAPKPAAVTPPTVTTGGVIPGESLLQSILTANAELAGIPQITMPIPQAPVQQPTLPTAPGKPTPQQQAAKTLRPTGKVITGKAKLIGFPNQGTHTLGNWESDDAVDIAMPTGTPIYAVADGVIGSQIGPLTSSTSSRFAGNRVHLKIAGNELYYAHLSRLAVKAGQRVKRGQIIGYSGAANGVQHLHLGVRTGDPRRYA